MSKGRGKEAIEEATRQQSVRDEGGLDWGGVVAVKVGRNGGVLDLF